MRSFAILTVGILIVTSPAWGDFVLTDHDELTVNSYHENGTLYDWSRVYLVPDAEVTNLQAYFQSFIDISGGVVTNLKAQCEGLYGGGKNINISGGTVTNLQAYQESYMSMSGGAVANLQAYERSYITISDGTVTDFTTGGWEWPGVFMGNLTISGGTVTTLHNYSGGTFSVTGGTVGSIQNSEWGSGASVGVSGGTVTAIDNGSGGNSVSVSGGTVTTINNGSAEQSYYFAANVVNVSGGTVTNLNNGGQWREGFHKPLAYISGGTVTNLNYDSTNYDSDSPDPPGPGVYVSGGTVTNLSGRGQISVSGGNVSSAFDASNSIDLWMTGGQFSGSVSSLNMSDGEFNGTTGGGDVSGGRLPSLALNGGELTVSGGIIGSMVMGDGAQMDMSGGTIGSLVYAGASSLILSGGSIGDLMAEYGGPITFVGKEFIASGGLIIDGDIVLGTGQLSGRWMDGTSWVVNIDEHDAGQLIQLVPEPATLSLLALGGLAVTRRSRKRSRP